MNFEICFLVLGVVIQASPHAAAPVPHVYPVETVKNDPYIDTSVYPVNITVSTTPVSSCGCGSECKCNANGPHSTCNCGPDCQCGAKAVVPLKGSSCGCGSDCKCNANGPHSTCNCGPSCNCGAKKPQTYPPIPVSGDKCECDVKTSTIQADE